MENVEVRAVEIDREEGGRLWARAADGVVVEAPDLESLEGMLAEVRRRDGLRGVA